ncbi:MAG TPA: type IV pilus twitching motility protein PilT [Epulopiscium sp.]|nr:type IV pilus twitching motility protein PilT [Candidatus Epulonipiscium sp.]
MEIRDLLLMTKKMEASDLHITAGIPPMLRIHGELKRLEGNPLTPADTERLVYSLFEEDVLKEKFEEAGEVDFAYGKPSLGRYRVNAYRQRGTCALALRNVATNIPTMETLGLPSEILKDLSQNTRGLVLVTGPTGSGKSTTLATMIDYINRTRRCHILTLEDPIEYLHKHNKSIVNQREIGIDTKDYGIALRAALREDPDVILVGEMRDTETIATAITAAETGHLVLSTLHTLGASQTIDRIIDVFPPAQQEQIRVQLANLLQGVMSQQLLTHIDGNGRSVAYEIMLATSAISNLIREGKSYQISSHIQTSGKIGMQTMDANLIKLYKKGKITLEQVLKHSFAPREVKRMLNLL